MKGKKVLGRSLQTLLLDFLWWGGNGDGAVMGVWTAQ